MGLVNANFAVCDEPGAWEVTEERCFTTRYRPHKESLAVRSKLSTLAH